MTDKSVTTTLRSILVDGHGIPAAAPEFCGRLAPAGLRAEFRSVPSGL
jgi:hypothetical protein